jgi:hypothetical protein
MMLATRIGAAVLCLTLAASPLGVSADTQAVPPAAPDAARSTTALGAPAPAATNAPPVYGDLTHLTFTATGDLSAELISPHDGGAASGLAAIFEVGTVAGAGVEIKIDGVAVPFEHIGKRTVNNKTGATIYTYYGVPLHEGPNRVELTARPACAANR